MGLGMGMGTGVESRSLSSLAKLSIKGKRVVEGQS